MNKYPVYVWLRFKWYGVVFDSTLLQWRLIHNWASSTIQFASSESDSWGSEEVILWYRYIEFYYYLKIAMYVYKKVASVYQFIGIM